jgi:hypothetical protein
LPKCGNNQDILQWRMDKQIVAHSTMEYYSIIKRNELERAIRGWI